ncbi:MAG TPA: peptidoglycan DD-metalloendopeptidase family protein [Dictyoglomaceae bacterium]|nr:peptidoglycan DD-metalloendopeptidase family protein [Dictyoglomaceae bacterium]HPU42848.1 peptidoglycan DD-metalloendopeptidase family protein [Dictyoglomaceae bacterium]
MIRKLISGILFILLVFNLTLTKGVSADVLSQKQKELQQKKQQIQDLKSKVKTLEKTEVNIVSEINSIDRELDQAEKELNVAETKLRESQARLLVLSTQLNLTQRNLKFRILNYKENLGEVFKVLQTLKADLILCEDSFNTLAVPYYLRSLIKVEANRITEINNQYKDLTQKKKEWEEEKKNAEVLVKNISDKKAYIEKKKREKTAYLDKVRTQKKYQQQVIATLEKESKEIENMIKKLASSSVQKAQKGKLSWPVIGSISSKFGMRPHPILGGAPLSHTGIDIAVAYGTPIKAAASGKVIYAGWYGGYGNLIILDHGGNISTLYGHLSKIVVKIGEEVAEGEIIGYVGSTGLSTGPHLHFEVRVTGSPVDPAGWLK